MKRIVKIVICCLLFVNIFGINNVYAAAYSSLELRYGDDIVTYSWDGTPATTIDPVEGEAINGLNVGFSNDESEDIFVLTPEKNLDLDDFFINTNECVRIVLDHDITITSEIDEIGRIVQGHIPGVIYADGALEVVGNHELTINYSISESVYKQIPSGSASIACVYAGFFSFEGDGINNPIININECTNKEIIKDKLPMTIGTPILCLITDRGYKPPLIKNATVNIQSYAYGIISQTYLRTVNAIINLKRLGYYSITPGYTGIYCESFNEAVHNNTKISIKEDNNCGTSSYEEVYGLLSDVSSDLTFENCKLDIDLSKSDGVAIAVGSDSDPCVINFTDTYADIKGCVCVPYGALVFLGDSNLHFVNDTFPLQSESSGSVLQIGYEEGKVPTLLFETTSADGAWSKGFYNLYDFDDVVASTECGNWTSVSSFNQDYCEDYKWLSLRKDCTVSYSGIEIPPIYTPSFTKIPQPTPPAGYEDQEFLGWFYVDRFGDEVKFDFNDYVREDMNLYPKWKEKGVESFEIENFEFSYIYFGTNFDADFYNFMIENEYRYAFKDNECIYYAMAPNYYYVYDYQTGDEVDECDVVFDSDTYVYGMKAYVRDASEVFNDDTVVIVDGKEFPKLSKSKLIDKECVGPFDESYNGYYISDDGTNITLQFVSGVFEPYYVDTLEVEHDGFDFDTYSIDFLLPEGFKLFNNQKITSLIKDDEIKYSIYDVEDMRVIVDSDGEMVESIEDIDPFEVDSAVVMFVIEPAGSCAIFNEFSKLVVNDVSIKQTTDETIFIGMEEGYTGKISKDVEVCMVNEDSVDELIIQLYFSINDPSPTPDPHHDPGHNVPYIIPATGIK